MKRRIVNQRLIRDCARSATQHCMELLSDVLDEEQKLQAANGIFQIVQAGIEAFVLLDDRMQQRLKPLQN